MRLNNFLKCPICAKPLGKALQGADKRHHETKCIPALRAKTEAERKRGAKLKMQNPDKSGKFISKTTEPY